MSTSRHIDSFCIAGTVVMILLTVLFMSGSTFGLKETDRTVKYEQTLFDASYVHRIDIVMDDWDGFIENCEDEQYVPCTVVVDGKKHSNIAIRAKGNTSLSNVKQMGSSRYSFKLEFDHYEKGKTLDGLDKLCLNNLIQDNTMMKDYLVYRMMNDFGADGPLVSYAYLTVNGKDWGLYLAVEGIEDSFLSRNYGTDTGNLYKPDSMGFGGGKGNGRDFRMSEFDFGDDDSDEMQNEQQQKAQSGFGPGRDFQGTFAQQGQPSIPPFGEDRPNGRSGQGPQDPGAGFPFGGPPTGGERPEPTGGPGGGMGSDDVKLKYIDDDPESYANIFGNAKTKVSSADKERLIASLKQLSAYEDLTEVLDIDEVLRYFVVHNFVCNGDSYTGQMIHNYYLHEKDGKLSMIPWDYNLAFGTFQAGNASNSVNALIDSPVSGNVNDRPMVGWIFSDESYTERYHELFAEFIERWFTNAELEKLIADTAEMIRPFVEKDPTKFCTVEAFEKGVSVITQFVSLRGEAVRAQLAGDNNTPVACDSLVLSDMGSMGGGFGGPGGGGRRGPGLERPGMPEEEGQTENRSPDRPEPQMDAGAGLRPEQSREGESDPGEGNAAAEQTDHQSPPGNMDFGNFQPPTESGNADRSGGFPGQTGGTDSERPQPPSGGFGGPGSAGSFESQQKSSQKETLVWLGVSVLALAVGLLIAGKMKFK